MPFFARIALPAFAAALALGVSACGTNCRETVRMGDFEFSQGNYARAEQLFARALAEDSAACPDAREKQANALRFLGR
jgi:hypothetical protein